MAKRQGGFKVETIEKVKDLLVETTREFYEKIGQGEKLEISFSTGNMKIGRTLNVSIAPIITCGNCGKCSRYCYDVKAVLAYPSARRARAKNTAILQADRDEFFRQIDVKLNRARRRNKLFRWHVGGEIPDIDYFSRMVDMAKRHPDWTMWCYTKMYGIINNYCRQHGGRTAVPANLNVMFSEWLGEPIINPYGFPEFRTVEKGGRLDCHKCPGNCEICYNTGRGCPFGETSYIELH